jgi:hypothetical protein
MHVWPKRACPAAHAVCIGAWKGWNEIKTNLLFAIKCKLATKPGYTWHTPWIRQADRWILCRSWPIWSAIVPTAVREYSTPAPPPKPTKSSPAIRDRSQQPCPADWPHRIEIGRRPAQLILCSCRTVLSTNPAVLLCCGLAILVRTPAPWWATTCTRSRAVSTGWLACCRGRGQRFALHPVVLSGNREALEAGRGFAVEAQSGECVQRWAIGISLPFSLQGGLGGRPDCTVGSFAGGRRPTAWGQHRGSLLLGESYFAPTADPIWGSAQGRSTQSANGLARWAFFIFSGFLPFIFFLFCFLFNGIIWTF